MRAAGVREFKNNLSEYLSLVAQGEVVLVTDHGRVVAQLAPPPGYVPSYLTDDQALQRPHGERLDSIWEDLRADRRPPGDGA